jgi:hypothetical protein
VNRLSDGRPAASIRARAEQERPSVMIRPRSVAPQGKPLSNASELIDLGRNTETYDLPRIRGAGSLTSP